jgi:hypothetical protein
MRRALVERGLAEAAVERILRQWRGKTMKQHRAYFNNFFVPFCRAYGYHPFEFRSDSLVNCLEFNLQRMEDLAARENRPPQHGTLKKLRAAVSETWKVIFGQRITFHPDVEDMFKVARLEAPLTKAYSTTWDINLIFDYYQSMAVTGLPEAGLPGPLTNETLPLTVLRDKVIILAKIKIGCRSVDLTKVSRFWVRQNVADSRSQACLMGLRPVRGSRPRIERWRYLLPKNVGSLADVYSPWIDLGGYADYVPLDQNICFRSALEIYYQRTDGLNLGSERAMFLSAYSSRDGTRHGLSSDRIRNVVGKVMTAAGVPEKFRPHSTRHAFLADSAQRGVQEEAFLASAQMSGRVFELYYKCPIEQTCAHQALVPAVGLVPDSSHPPAVLLELTYDSRAEDTERC